MISNPLVEAHPDGWKATWPGYPKAFALFSVQGNHVDISDIFRDQAQPKGSAGAMLAQALRDQKVGMLHPKSVRMVNILEDQPTVNQIKQGITEANTVLGKTIQNLARELGATIIRWNHGVERNKLWLEAKFA